MITVTNAEKLMFSIYANVFSLCKTKVLLLWKHYKLIWHDVTNFTVVSNAQFETHIYNGKIIERNDNITSRVRKILSVLVCFFLDTEINVV